LRVFGPELAPSDRGVLAREGEWEPAAQRELPSAEWAGPTKCAGKGTREHAGSPSLTRAEGGATRRLRVNWCESVSGAALSGSR